MGDNNKLFIDRIRDDKSFNTREIVRKIKNKEISIESLNEKEKKEVYLFIKKEVLNKRIELNNLKNKILCNKAKYVCQKKKRI